MKRFSRFSRAVAIVSASLLVGGLLVTGAPTAAAQTAIPEDGAPGRGTFYYDAGDDRYYEVVTYSGGDRTWTTARDDAASRTIFGGAYRGHLATILTQAQNEFIVQVIGDVDGFGVAGAGGFVNLWIGATDEGSEGDWRWATGPSAGLAFWQGGAAGGPVSGRFSAWAALEPSNTPSGGGPAENYAIANYRCTLAPYNQPCTATSSWNDAVGTGTVTDYVAGYLIAYTAVPAASASAPTLSCTPDPVAVGAVVTCVVTGGPPGGDILWRASIDSTFASQGVTMGPDGSGTFTFLVPAGSAGRSILVELVAWSAQDSVAVLGTLVPTSIPAGPEVPASTGLLAVLAVVLLAVGARRRLLPSA